MDFSSITAYLPYIVGIAVVLFLYQKYSHRVRVRVPGSNVSVDDVLGKVLPSYQEGKLNRQIAAYRKQGNALAAGKLLEDAGRLPEAADAYVEGQEFFAAATTLEKL